MKPISYEEFIAYLERYGTAVHCEMYANNYTQYFSAEEPGEGIVYSMDHGCVICAGDGCTQ